MLGLSLIALGIYLTLVLYLGWEGGRVGSSAETALTYLFGGVAYTAPVALFACGAVLILRPFLPSVKPLRAGGICIGAGLLLAFAAQTAGLGPEHPPRPDQLDPSWFPDHGGIVGEALYWSTATLFQRVGAHIVAVLLVVAGALLLTGTSIATFLSGANPYLPKTTLSEMLLTHGSQHISQIQQLAAHDTAGEAKTAAAMRTHIIALADALADAIAKQFPTKV